MITIIDYGLGNLGSIQNMLKRIGATSFLTSDINDILKAEKLLLPGVGAFDTAMKKIEELNLKEIICDKVNLQKTPILGICLGMQLLMEGSEEGILPGLGLIKGKAYHFRNHIDKKLKIPHMGWNDVTIHNESILTKGFFDEMRFYFVHSYYVKTENSDDSMLECNYGIDFDAAVHKDNIYGTQFHPEKSHKFGMQLLHNFALL
jgi:glutamine amidotransferase